MARINCRCVGGPRRLPHRQVGGRADVSRRRGDVAVEAGFRWALALPLRLRDLTIGALNLVSVEQAPMDEADLVLARALADLATISVLQQRAVADAQLVNEQLSHALTSRIVIEQAKGDLRACGYRSVRGVRAAPELRPQAQPPPYGRRASRHRWQPRSAGVGYYVTFVLSGPTRDVRDSQLHARREPLMATSH
jgi:hypothetical protein